MEKRTFRMSSDALVIKTKGQNSKFRCGEHYSGCSEFIN